MDDLEKLKYSDLQKELRRRGLKATGKTDELRHRLKNAIESKSLKEEEELEDEGEHETEEGTYKLLNKPFIL